MGLDELVISGDAFYVNSGTKVLVIDKNIWGNCQVRILEGKFEGVKGWLHASWVKKQ